MNAFFLNGIEEEEKIDPEEQARNQRQEEILEIAKNF